MAKTMMVPGAGTSKTFTAPVGTFTEDKILDCQLTQVTWAHTDEGREENNRGKSSVHVSISDPIDNVAGKLKDGYAAGMEAWEVPDARRELMDQHVPQGYRGRWLSQAKIAEQGMRGFEVAKEAGEPVKLGTMILGQMPEERVQKREAYMRGRKHDQQRAARDDVREQQERLVAESRGGLRPIAGDRYNGVPQQDSFTVEAERESRREAGAAEFSL
jgi:hypothetical protein